MIKIRCLSIRQPWAWLVAQGYKDIENRTWKTNFRGEFLIHASRTFDMKGYLYLKQLQTNEPKLLEGIEIPHCNSFSHGGIVGKATLVNCVTQSKSKWFVGPYGFVLRDAQQLPYKPMPGKRRFFEIKTA
jgi:hypothetical protein